MLGFFLTMAVGAAIGFVFYKLKAPGGLMIGALVGVVALNAATEMAYMPFAAKFFAQVVAGAFIGSTVEKRDLVQLPRLVGPLAVMLGCLLITNITVGLLINAFSPLSLITALFSSIPGGMSDVPIIAADMGADPGKVVTLQFLRMAMGIGVFPSMIYAMDKRLAKKMHTSECGESPAPAAPAVPAEARDTSALSLAITALVAALAGLLGYFAAIPAGTLIFAMAAVISLRMLTGKGYLPKGVRRVAQVFSGCYIGCSMGLSDLIEMKYLVVPALILFAGYIANCLTAGFLLQKLFGFERKMAMLAATPAGASDMALISADIGVTSADLVVLQVLRLIFVISIFPQADALIARILG